MLTEKLCVPSALTMVKSPFIISGICVRTNSDGSVSLYVGATVVGGTFCTKCMHKIQLWLSLAICSSTGTAACSNTNTKSSAGYWSADAGCSLNQVHNVRAGRAGAGDVHAIRILLKRTATYKTTTKPKQLSGQRTEGEASQVPSETAYRDRQLNRLVHNARALAEHR